ncbi:MAG: putative glycolipid-binding domain-containing protein [Dehalococcoidia bacterium]
MQRNVIWSRWDEPGLEHLRLTTAEGGVLADGLIIGVDEGRPYRARYEVRCDSAWRVREVQITTPGSDSPALHLLTDGAGRWTTAAGEPLPALDGCLDVDIFPTPYTNTLPIRRLEWQRGASADLAVAWIALPEMTVQRSPQRYTCLAPLTSKGGSFRYASLSSDFTADLPLDTDGLVLDYPGLVRRVV